MERVMILGQPGAGKTTLARHLGARTGLPVHHMDRIHHLSGWRPRPLADKIAMTREIHRQPRWILEGGMSATYDDRIAHADTAIFLDLPVATRLARVTLRSLRYWGRNRPDLPDGCLEGFHGETLEFYRYIWRTRQSGRDKVRALFDRAPSHVTCHWIASTADIAGFLDRAPQHNPPHKERPARA